MDKLNLIFTEPCNPCLPFGTFTACFAVSYEGMFELCLLGCKEVVLIIYRCKDRSI